MIEPFGREQMVMLAYLGLVSLSVGALAQEKLNGPLAVALVGDVQELRLANDGRVAVYLADQERDEVLELYARTEGQPGAVRINSPLPQNGQVEPGFLLTGDGARAVYRADQDANNRIELFSVATDGAAPPVRLNGTLPNGGDVRPGFQLSPDASRVVYLADQDTNNRVELYSVPLDASAAPVRLNAPLAALRNVLPGFAISPDGTRVVYRSDQDQAGVVELYVAPIDVAGAAQKLSGILVAGGDVARFAISPDGGHVVYLADQDTDDVLELYAAALDASATAVRLNAPLVAGRQVEDFWIGSSGGHVAYLADQDVDEQVRLYSVPIDASAPPILLNAPLPAAWDVTTARPSTVGDRIVYDAQRFEHQMRELHSVPIDGAQAPVPLFVDPDPNVHVRHFAISPDGSRVVYTANLAFQAPHELFSVPIDGSQQAVVLSGTFHPDGDVAVFSSQPLEISADSTRVVYLADQDLDEVFELFSAPLAGGVAPVRLNMPLVAARNVTSYVLSGDGARVGYVADQEVDELFEAFGAGSAGGFGPVRLSDAFSLGAQAGDVLSFALSPDGSRAIYRADQDTDEAFELYSVPTDGSEAPVRLNANLIPDGDVERGFRIGSDSARVVFSAEQSGEACGLAEACELYSVAIDGSASPVRLNSPLGPDGGLFSYAFTSDAARVLYTSYDGVDFASDLFSVLSDGGGPPIALNDPRPGGFGVFSDVGSPDGCHVVYLADDDGAPFELFSVPVDRQTDPIKLSGPLVFGGSVGVGVEFGTFPPQITPDSSTVVYLADQDTDDLTEIYSVPLDGTRPAVKLNGPLIPAGDVLVALIATDSTALFVADAALDDVYELFRVPIDGSQPPFRLHPQLGPGQNAGVPGVSPDGTRVVFSADLDQVGVYELYSVPLLGSAPLVKLNRPLVAGARVETFLISPNSRRVVYLAGTNDRQQLWSVPIDGSASARRLNAPLPAGSTVQDDFQLALDGKLVLYRSGQDTNGVVELYAVGIDGGTPHKLSGPMVPGGNASSFQLAPAGGRVVYQADQDANNVRELYSSPLRDLPRRAQEPAARR